MTGELTAYNWNDLDREVVRRGVERVGFAGDHMLCVLNWLTPGMELRPHNHDFEQLVLILQGRVRLHVGDETFTLEPGGMIRIPANVMHHAEPLGEEVVLNLDVFSPVRADYRHLLDYQSAPDG